MAAMHFAELAPDGGKRARQDGLVERAHEGGQEHPKDDQQRLAMGEEVTAFGGTSIAIRLSRSQKGSPSGGVPSDKRL